ncbi:isoleucyl-tRNA synthetase [Achromobacter sp. AONIH1]|nr:isoleucyl-tRNA synthetase [Achromobacter sp. AONIH1]
MLQVCLQWRNRNRLRNTAEGLDEHILKDMGAPDWLVSEASVSREFKRLRNIDYFRW